MLGDLWQALGGLWTFIGAIIWIIVMIDCLRSSRTKNKIGWLLFIFFANWVGVVVYLFVIRADLLKQAYKAIQKWVRQQSAGTPHYPPYSPQPPPQPPYNDYRQGYPAYQPPATPTPSATTEQTSAYQSYEQPQAIYPEMPPMEQ